MKTFACALFILLGLFLLGCPNPPKPSGNASCGDGTCSAEEQDYVSRGLCSPCPPLAVCMPCPPYDLVLVCPADCGENPCERSSGYCAEPRDSVPTSFTISNLSCNDTRQCWLYNY